MGRAALLLALLSATGFLWLAVNRCGTCLITLDVGLALVGLVVGGLGSVGLTVVNAGWALHGWWDERRSRNWRLTPYPPRR